MKNIPSKIYLQVGEDPGEDFKELDTEHVSWCTDRINESDIEYVLAPTVQGEGERKTETVGSIISDAMKLHELNVSTVERELRWSFGVLSRVMNDDYYTNSVPIVLFKNLLLSLHIPFKKIEAAMLPTFRLMLSKETPESIKKKPRHYQLWENEEAVGKYTKMLCELMGTQNVPINPWRKSEVSTPENEHAKKIALAFAEYLSHKNYEQDFDHGRARWNEIEDPHLHGEDGPEILTSHQVFLMFADANPELFSSPYPSHLKAK